MADNLTTTVEIPPAIRIYYDRVLLVNAKPKLHHEHFAQKRNIPGKSGDTIKFSRFAKLATATTPITQGINPPGQKMDITTLTARVSQYGDYVHVTDWVNLIDQDPVLTERNELLGDQEGRTRDELVRDILIACASSTNASGGDNGNTPTEITQADIDAIVVTLLGSDAEMMVPKQRASTGVGTSPVRDAFWGIMNTVLIPDIEDCSGFRSISEYPQAQAEDGEWGATKNVRWLYSTVAHASSDSPVQYHLPIIGKNSYAVTDLEGASESIIKPFGAGDDPLNLKCTAGWKMAFVARILNDTFIHLLKVTLGT